MKILLIFFTMAFLCVGCQEQKAVQYGFANANNNIEAIQKNKFYKPDFFCKYEESQWGEACWSLSSLLSFPVIALLVVPCCELWGWYMYNSENHFFLNPRLSYMGSPYTRYVSDKFIIEPVYYILSIPVIFLKYLCDW